MNIHFPPIRLGEVVTPINRPERPVPGVRYRQLGVKLWGQGAYERETIDGSQTQYRTLSRVETDDIVVNKIWARNGSIAVVPKHIAGCYGSTEFPLFAPMKDRLDPRWFHWFTKSPLLWQQTEEKSRGTSGKNRIRPEKFLEITIPLPPLAEQRRILARIEMLAGRYEEVCRLRQEIASESQSLCRAIIFQASNSNAIRTKMRDLVRMKDVNITVDRSQTYQFAGVYCFGRGVFKGIQKAGSEFSYARLTRITTNDFVYPKLMAWEGALGVVPASCDGCYVSPEFPVFEIDQSKVLPETLDVYFRTPAIWPALATISSGTNVRRRRLHPTRFLEFEFPLPPMQIQLRLRSVMSKMEKLKPINARIDEEVDGLLPSILSKAFSGEL